MAMTREERRDEVFARALLIAERCELAAKYLDDDPEKRERMLQKARSGRELVRKYMEQDLEEEVRSLGRR
jgi:hypothetical protein